MTGDCHVPFRGSLGVKLPGATRLDEFCGSLVGMNPPQTLDVRDRQRLLALKRLVESCLDNSLGVERLNVCHESIMAEGSCLHSNPPWVVEKRSYSA